MTADPLRNLGALAGAAALGRADALARFARVTAAQLDAGQAACRFIAAAGHQGRHRNCRACSVLADAEVAGLWTPEPDPKEATTP